MYAGKKLCILGIGNTLRGDDGIGPYMVGELSRLPLRYTELICIHALQTEWMERLAGYEDIILIDAATRGLETVRFDALQPGESTADTGSHYMVPAILLSMLTGLFKASPRILVCAIPGYEFSFRETLSEKALKKTADALKILEQWLAENGYLE